MVKNIFLFLFIIVGIVVSAFFFIVKRKKNLEQSFLPSWENDGIICDEKNEEIEYSETQKALYFLLNELEGVGKVYGEIYDIECREQITHAILNIFVFEKEGYLMPQNFGLYHEDGNKAVYIALDKYIKRVSALAKGLEITDIKERMNLLHDTAVYSNEEQTVDNFLLGL